MDDAQVVDIKDRNYWSLSQLSSAFGPARETISKRLVAAGVHSDRKRAGHEVFHIAEAARAILAGELPTWEGVEDPEKLPPKDRKDWYQSENERAKYLREAGQLVPAGEVQQQFAHVVKICVRRLETLPDVLEMKCQLPPDAVQAVEAECDAARAELARELSE